MTVHDNRAIGIAAALRSGKTPRMCLTTARQGDLLMRRMGDTTLRGPATPPSGVVIRANADKIAPVISLHFDLADGGAAANVAGHLFRSFDWLQPFFAFVIWLHAIPIESVIICLCGIIEQSGFVGALDDFFDRHIYVICVLNHSV